MRALIFIALIAFAVIAFVRMHKAGNTQDAPTGGGFVGENHGDKDHDDDEEHETEREDY